MKYRISVKDVSHGCIEVEASSDAEAYEKAETEYMMGMTMWNDEQYELTNAQPIKETHREEAR